jgi:hypothetical protein
MRKIIFFIISFTTLIFSQKKLIDDFDSLSGWNIFQSDGVDSDLSLADGIKGKAVRFDYDFTKGSGYGGFQKIISLDLPENFQFSFYLKAESPNNNFEVKFLDTTGENVWWMNNRNYEFPGEWKKFTIKKRHISFAWGPTDDKNLKEINRIEFTIASYSGGKGSIFIDDLYFEELPPVTTYLQEPVFSASSELNDYEIKSVFDGSPTTKWMSDNSEEESILIDFKQYREIGGFTIEWDKNSYPREYEIHLSDDQKSWEIFYKVLHNRGERSYVRLKDAEAQYAKIILRNSNGAGFGIQEIKILDPLYSENQNRFIINMAKDYPRGYFPRYFFEEASFWNVVGVNSDVKEALINEDGIIETDKASFSVEPMLFTDNKLITWNEAAKVQGLLNCYLPIPWVRWTYNDTWLEIETFASGEANKNSVLYANYKIVNAGTSIKKGKLFLLVRPFQVNPYYQELNLTGGVSKISSVKIGKSGVRVNDKTIYPLTAFNEAGALRFEEGNIVSYLSKGIIPENNEITDQFNSGSAVLSYDYEIEPNEEKEILLAIPFYENIYVINSNTYKTARSETIKFWEEKLSYIKFDLPPSAEKIINTYRSNLAYILINRDKAGIQPGSRSYERSWIRDGSLTSSALLKSGIHEEVKEFINWYSAHQYENGKIPCVVDSRGPDPVPENDSHGEYIFLVKQYFNFTKDTSLLRDQNDRVKKTVDYIQYLVSQRSADHYKHGNDSIRAYYGIMPESISHEGYSAKPMHSYWDNFFTMRGLKDAADIQAILGDKEAFRKISKIRDEFRENLYNSLRLAIKTREIDYIPGSVELGDFDATSTTIALYPVNEFPNLPQPYLNNTFNRYYSFFKERRDAEREWENYTPYEVRTIGSFIFLDQPEKAHELIDFFMKDQKPQGWNHWAEVVWREDRKPAFIGDMPHTWVGSDFINAIRSMLVYENDYDTSLVIGAGLYQDWLDSPGGMSVRYLPTYYGDLSYSIKKDSSTYIFNIYGELEKPSGNIIIKNFNSSKMPVNVLVNGRKTNNFTSNSITVNEFPAELRINYD